jgi:hypothetical protein
LKINKYLKQVPAMTNPKYSETVVVIAGYSEEMEELLLSNQGVHNKQNKTYTD